VSDVRGSIDVELAYIGACLTDTETLADATITGDDFDNPTLGIIFDRMRERLGRKLGVSQALLSEDFPQHVVLIWGSTDSMSETVLGRHHEQAIRDRSVRRKLKFAATRIAAIADGNEMEDIVDRARAEVDAALRGDTAKVTSMLVDAHAILAEHRTEIALVASPWQDMNGIIGGFGPGRMYVIGARPGVGKSALASQIAYELAGHGPVIFATMEMEKGEVYSRIVSQQAGVYYGGMRGQTSEYIRAKEQAWLETGLRDIRVIDAGTQTVGGIRSAVRSATRDGVVAGVVVDYIHLLTSTEGENETNRIASITRALKQLAMDFKVPVIALSQLNRGGNGLPGLRDLRGSGAIEQDGDVVVFLYRDVNEEGAVVDESTLKVYVAKNRQGASFVGFDLEWQGEFVRAVDKR